MPCADQHTGVILAEIGLLLLLFAGLWFAAAEVPLFTFAAGRRIVASVAPAAGA
jgi:hypothetical protein